jgi:hypothetical protein
MTSGAFESSLLKARFGDRDSSQSHPVLAGRARRSFSNRRYNTHHPTQKWMALRQQVKRNTINITMTADASDQMGNRSRHRRGVLSRQRRGGM